MYTVGNCYTLSKVLKGVQPHEMYIILCNKLFKICEIVLLNYLTYFEKFISKTCCHLILECIGKVQLVFHCALVKK